MKKRLGVVLEVENGRAIVMTHGGEFKRVKVLQDISVGAEVPVPGSSWSLLSVRTWGAVAAVLLLVLAGTVIPHWAAVASPAAYVSLDMESSVEFGIDRNGNVVEVNPLDQEALAVVSSLELRGKNVNEAVEAVARKSVELGYSGKDDYGVLITGIPCRTGTRRPLGEIVSEIQDRLSRILTERQSGGGMGRGQGDGGSGPGRNGGGASGGQQGAGGSGGQRGTGASSGEEKRIVAFVGPKTLRDKARGTGLSVGKYVVFEEVKKLGIQVDAGEVQKLGMKGALTKAGANPEEILETVRERIESQMHSITEKPSRPTRGEGKTTSPVRRGEDKTPGGTVRGEDKAPGRAGGESILPGQGKEDAGKSPADRPASAPGRPTFPLGRPPDEDKRTVPGRPTQYDNRSTSGPGPGSSPGPGKGLGPSPSPAPGWSSDGKITNTGEAGAVETVLKKLLGGGTFRAGDQIGSGVLGEELRYMFRGQKGNSPSREKNDKDAEGKEKGASKNGEESNAGDKGDGPARAGFPFWVRH